MHSRERFAYAMRHEAPDRVPIDIGGTSLTTIRTQVQEGLRNLLGFSGDAPNPGERVDERILQWADTDFRSVGRIIDLPSEHTRTLSDQAKINCWGIRSDFVDGEWQISNNPLRGASLADLRAFAWPEPRIEDTDLARWEAQAHKLSQENKYVVVAEHPVFGILELGCWMCGYDDFFLKMAAEPDFVHGFFDKVTEIQLAVIEQYYSVLGPYIDLTTSGDDFGSQNGPLISPAMLETLVVPYFSARVQRTKEIAKCYYWHHSCGSVVKLLDQIISCGVDILNPIQTSALDMQPSLLKERFGDRLVFWGGMDVQEFLPQAKPDEIAERVHELVDTLGENGGYVMAPAHVIQKDIPPRNIVAWVEALRGNSQQKT